MMFETSAKQVNKVYLICYSTFKSCRKIQAKSLKQKTVFCMSAKW